MGPGCLSPIATRYPTLAPSNPETQRREAQIQDPYPDKMMGPQVDFRPLEFEQQRSEPQQVRDRFYSSFLKKQFGSPTPPPGNGIGASRPGYYPEIVH
jgi:hypothetical protein